MAQKEKTYQIKVPVYTSAGIEGLTQRTGSKSRSAKPKLSWMAVPHAKSNIG